MIDKIKMIEKMLDTSWIWIQEESFSIEQNSSVRSKKEKMVI